MSEFVYGTSPLPGPKSDRVGMPAGVSADQYFAAADANGMLQAFADLKAALLTGTWHGLTAQSSPPTPPPLGQVKLFIRASDLNLCAVLSDGTVVSTSNIAPDPETLAVTSRGSTTARTLADRFADTVNVKDYGAVGDGVTNDTASVAAALTAAGTMKVIELPSPGPYLTTTFGTLPAGTYYPPLPATGASLRSIPGKLLDTISVKDFGAKGDGVTNDGPSIQAAINAAPAGSTVVLPTGTYLVSSSLPLLITKSLQIIGAGWGVTAGLSIGSIIQIAPTASNTTDVFLVQPTGGDVITVRFAELSIFACDGVHGRYGINLDGTNGQISYAVVDHVQITAFYPGASINGSGSGLANGTPSLSLITRSLFTGGIHLASCGDSVRITDNTFAADTGKALDVGFIAGASTLTFKGNMVFPDGGIHIGTTATAVQIVNNEFETGASFVGSNGAYIDIDGTAGSHARETMIERNSFQIVNGITTDTIRVNYADRTQIVGNRFDRGLTTSHDITITANAADTFIGANLWVDGGPYTSMVADSGTRTVFAGAFPSSGIFVVPANKAFGSLDDAGAARAMLFTNSSDGSVQLNGYHAQGAALLSVNGATYIFDNFGNLGLAVGSAASTVPSAGAVASFSAVHLKNNKAISWYDDGGTQRNVLITDAAGSVQLNGYHGAAVLVGSNGSTYVYDSNGNVGLVVSSALSTIPSVASVTTLWAGAARGTGQATAAFNTAGNLGGSVLLKDTGGGADNGGAAIFAASQGSFAALKGLIQNGANNTQGDVVMSTRRVSTDAALTEATRWTAAGDFQVSSKLILLGGINNNQAGFKHKRITTGSIAAATDVDVTVTWGTAFADANYTVTVSVVDTTAANASLKVVHITSIAAATCVVRVRNDSAGALTGTLHLIAVHD